MQARVWKRHIFHSNQIWYKLLRDMNRAFNISKTNPCVVEKAYFSPHATGVLKKVDWSRVRTRFVS